MMRVLFFEHEDFCVPGSLGDRAVQRDIKVVEHRADLAPAPDPREFDLLVVLGSVASAYDEAIQSWYRPELEAMRTAIAADVPVLGVCFGGQALAQALGGSVGQAAHDEIGWFGIETRAPELIEPGPWFQWHHDAFTLPDGIAPIASTKAGTQAFTHGPHLGVQFHPEVTMEIARTWVELGEEHLLQHGIDPEVLLAESERLAPQQRAAAFRLFDRFLERAEDQRRSRATSIRRTVGR